MTDAFSKWQEDLNRNIYVIDTDFQHCIKFHFSQDHEKMHADLTKFGEKVACQLEPLVRENNLSQNLPRLDAYNAIGERVDHVSHHPTYIQAGDIIYSTGLLKKMSQFGGLSACLSFLFLSAQTGEAGHNCPIACSAGIIRVFQKIGALPDKDFYLEKLTETAYSTNFTGAQFLTEIQGGSDVGLNAVKAEKDTDGNWRIFGEKWFCSNANADLIFLTARYDANKSGTKGLALFLVPALWKNKKNHYQIRRLKDKIGTRSMATGEIDFNGALALQVGELENSFHLVMDNVLHLSRLFNSFCVLGMARRAYFVALAYAERRVAFGHPIVDYPLVQENLARIKAENSALLAGIYATAKLQDEYDLYSSVETSETTIPVNAELLAFSRYDDSSVENKNSNKDDSHNKKMLLRLLVNLQKYLTALWSFEHIHHCLDVLAGNGTIETFSPIPRLLRDALVCENWEGTHNLLRAQIHKDILKYHIDQIYLTYMQDKLAGIKDSSLPFLSIKEGLKELMEDLTIFRQLDASQQALKIRFIVDRMAILFCALSLYIESVHQQKMQSNESKSLCYRYFTLLHLNKTPIPIDQAYLSLIKDILVCDFNHAVK